MAKKLRTALLEMRTALLETRTTKSMRVSGKNKFVAVNFNEHSESEFHYPGELSGAALLQLSTHSETTERMSTLLINEEVHNFRSKNKQTGGQENHSSA